MGFIVYSALAWAHWRSGSDLSSTGQTETDEVPAHDTCHPYLHGGRDPVGQAPPQLLPSRPATPDQTGQARLY